MKNLLLLLAIASVTGFTACKQKTTIGTGQIKKEQRDVKPFDELKVTAPMHVVIMVDSNSATMPTVQIEGYENLLPVINAEVSGNELVIKTSGGNVESDKDLVAYITVASLKSLKFEGYTTADVKGKLKGDNIKLDISGAGDVIIDGVYVNSMDVKISGAGTLEIKDGYAQDASYHLSGAGDIKAFGLVSMNVEAKVSGAGSMELNAVKTLEGSISGAGSIDYKGQPTVASHISGAGSLNKVDK